MTIDKSWTTISNRNSKDFLLGLKAFLEHCKTLLNPISGEIACPCDECGNSETGSLKTLWQHISQNGFDPTYTIWDKHGETLPPVPPPVVHNPPQPPPPEYDNMAAFLDEVIRPDNEPIQPTQTTGPQPTQTTGPQPTQTTGPRINKEFEKSLKKAFKQNGSQPLKALKKAFKQNGSQPLKIDFDFGDLKTVKPVGKNAAYLSSYIGELVRDIPQDFKSWNKVPAAEKAKIIPNLQRYFDLQSHFRDETLIKVKGENKTKGSVVRGGLERDFADRYSSHKNKFKYKWFTKAGSVQAARQKKPPNWKAGDDEWQKLVDFWADPDRMAQSERNSNNRSKNKVTTHQGSKSFARGRHEFYEENKYQEDMVETWRKNHSDNNGHFQTRENERIYAEMKAIQDAVNDKKIDPKTDREIVAEVLQSNNRGHIAGVGRVVPGTGSSSRSSQADPSFCTREEFEEMEKKHAMELDEQRKAYESQGNVLKQFVEFFNRQQGTPASQFQIPDLYTPRVFPGSTYDVGGPSSTPSAPSSSLGPENCYIPTFDSGNSRIVHVDDDDDGRDGNREDDGVDGEGSSEYDDAGDDE